VIVTQWTRINGTDGSTGCWADKQMRARGPENIEKKEQHTVVESRNSNLKLFLF
jgi:hypothetical protein